MYLCTFFFFLVAFKVFAAEYHFLARGLEKRCLCLGLMFCHSTNKGLASAARWEMGSSRRWKAFSQSAIPTYEINPLSAWKWCLRVWFLQARWALSFHLSSWKQLRANLPESNWNSVSWSSCFLLYLLFLLAHVFALLPTIASSSIFLGPYAPNAGAAELWQHKNTFLQF